MSTRVVPVPGIVDMTSSQTYKCRVDPTPRSGSRTPASRKDDAVQPFL